MPREYRLSPLKKAINVMLRRMFTRGKGPPDGYVVTVNGYPVPLLATDNPDIHVGGVRFKAWQPPSALHPTISTDVPLRFELIDLTTGTSRGGCIGQCASLPALSK